VRRLQSVTDAPSRTCASPSCCRHLLERTRQILEVDTCAILLLDEETDELVVGVALGRTPAASVYGVL
jgi:hypothetical protein